MDANLNSHNFYNWFLNIGGEVSKLNYEKIGSSLNRIPLLHANLKTKPKEIKDKYNHKFVHKNRHL